MKAKQYADRYRANPTTKELNEIAFDFLIESKELIIKRRVKSNAAVFAVLNELDDKWRTFVRLAGDETIREDGFERVIMKEFPAVGFFWIESRRQPSKRT